MTLLTPVASGHAIPAGQGVHSVCPPTEYSPLAQAMGVPDVVVGHLKPAGHGEHDVEPAAANEPTDEKQHVTNWSLQQRQQIGIRLTRTKSYIHMI